MNRFSSNGLAMSYAEARTAESGIKHVAVFAPRSLGDRTPFEVRRDQG